MKNNWQENTHIYPEMVTAINNLQHDYANATGGYQQPSSIWDTRTQLTSPTHTVKKNAHNNNSQQNYANATAGSANAMNKATKGSPTPTPSPALKTGLWYSPKDFYRWLIGKEK